MRPWNGRHATVWNTWGEGNLGPRAGSYYRKAELVLLLGRTLIELFKNGGSELFTPESTELEIEKTKNKNIICRGCFRI